MEIITREIERLSKDVKEAAKLIGADEARYLVDMYYTLQENRIASDAQARELSKEEKPLATISWFAGQQETLEKRANQALTIYAESHPIGVWLMRQRGIAGVISAGLLCRERVFMNANHVSQVWSYAGLSADCTGRKKGEKLRHDPAMKRILWLAGDCLIKAQRPDDTYRKIYDQRKAYETKKNENGDYADQAKKMLETKKFDTSTDAFKHYSEGRLPPAQIHARCKRYMFKILLSHLFSVWKYHATGEWPALPYVIAIAGHADYIDPPFKDTIKPKAL